MRLTNSVKQHIKTIFSTTLIACVITMAIAPAQAADDSKNKTESQAQQTETAPKSSALPIDLVADKGNYDPVAGLAVYEGNVVVTQGVATMRADKLTIYLVNNAAERLEVEGKPAKFEYKGDKQPIYGEGLQGIYYVVEKKIKLSGNAMVKQGEDVVKGNVLTYNVDSEIITGNRVKMTFLPKK